MAVPLYYRSRHGHVFRLHRARAELPDGRSRYVVRAVPLAAHGSGGGLPVEVGEESSLDDLRDHVRRGHVVRTTERIFDDLWQNLRLKLESPE